jgi:Fe-S oxidoreductase
VPTTFDFTTDGGLLPAAELCAGVGACRKRGEGTMCPSFQATREEKDSTRGRANLLRLALSGQLGFTGLTDPHVREALDLCLECKACKGECPTNVDMARLKAEFLHQYHREHGLPLRHLVFGHVAELGRVGGALAPLSSWLARSGPARWLNEKLLGIDRRRMPPAFARRSLARRFRSREGEPPGEPSPRAARTEPRPPEETVDAPGLPVLLFPDTFTNFFEPEVGEAAIELLRRAGRAVTLGPPGLRCCGRPLISNGLLDEAVANARHNVELLHEWSRQGRPIVACEPSCILTIRDDYPALLRGEFRSRAESVAAACLTVEELLAGLMTGQEGGGLRLNPGPRRILAHAHCHQRSLIGVGPLMALLRSIPGAEVIDLDAGCCGMAGSFGYEIEHYDVSRLVGEQRLLPAARRARPDDVLVAPGFSCRLQVRHFTGLEAVHPVALIKSCLAGA